VTGKIELPLGFSTADAGYAAKANCSSLKRCLGEGQRRLRRRVIELGQGRRLFLLGHSSELNADLRQFLGDLLGISRERLQRLEHLDLHLVVIGHFILPHESGTRNHTMPSIRKYLCRSITFLLVA